MAEQTETREIAARRAYDTWRWHYDHVTRWNELFPGAQVLWLNVADAVLSANRTEPDWADLREMARNAGWAGHADEPHVRIWGANGTDRMNLDWDAGSVRVFRHGLVVDLAGPSATYTHESVHLINPTPARVLAGARLVGLGGAS